jgi:hypothetical protein
MYKVIYHHYHKQNYCNVILNSTGKNMIANVYYQIIIMFYCQIMFYCNPAYTANCPVNLLSYQTISTINDKRVLRIDMNFVHLYV